MAYHQGVVEGCWWAYFHGEVEPAEWARFVVDSRRIYASARPGDVLLTIPYRYGAPSALQRKALADVIASSPGAANLSHHAFATDSTVVLAVNTAIGWLGRKPWRERCFSAPDDALAWLVQARPALRADAVAADLRRFVPEAILWPALRERRPTAG